MSCTIVGRLFGNKNDTSYIEPQQRFVIPCKTPKIMLGMQAPPIVVSEAFANRFDITGSVYVYWILTNWQTTGFAVISIFWSPG